MEKEGWTMGSEVQLHRRTPSDASQPRRGLFSKNYLLHKDLEEGTLRVPNTKKW
jgi:hypothetical protein